MIQRFTPPLSGPSIIPDSPDGLVILFHGYGASGNDLFSLANEWSPLFPRTAFFSPNAPLPHEYGGRMWFEIEEMQENHLMLNAQRALPHALNYILYLKNHFNLPQGRIIVCGFSQGSMLSLLSFLSQKDIFNHVLSYSGGLPGGILHPLFPEKGSVSLIHGLEDTVVPAGYSEKTSLYFEGLGIKTSLTLIPNLPHSINEEGIEIGKKMLLEILS